MLSIIESQLLSLITEEGLNIKQASKRLNKGTSWLYRVRKSLIKKGYLKHKYDILGTIPKEGGYWGGPPGRVYKDIWKKNTSVSCGDVTTFRLHAEMFTIRLFGTLTFGQKEGDIQYIGSNKYIVYKHSIVIYGLKSFVGSLDDILYQSSKYWTAVFLKLSSNFGIDLLDASTCSISLNRSHISKTGDPLAKNLNKDSLQLKVYSEEGKLRLIVDNSYNLNEIEAIDKGTNIQDIHSVERYFADLLEKNHYRPSESREWIEGLKEISEYHAKQLREIKQSIAYIVSHIAKK